MTIDLSQSTALTASILYSSGRPLDGSDGEPAWHIAWRGQHPWHRFCDAPAQPTEDDYLDMAEARRMAHSASHADAAADALLSIRNQREATVARAMETF